MRQGHSFGSPSSGVVPWQVRGEAAKATKEIRLTELRESIRLAGGEREELRVNLYFRDEKLRPGSVVLNRFECEDFSST